MSTIEANTLKPISGSSTLTLGESGDTVSLGSGVTAGTGIGTTINNNADNRVITGSGTANTLEGEANLTYDGSILGVNIASPTMIAGTGMHLTSSGSDCRLHISNATVGNTASDGGYLFMGSDGTLGLLNSENADIRFYTNATQRAAIDGSGNILFGKTSNNWTDGGIQFEKTSGSSEYYLISTRDDSDEHITTRKNNATGSAIKFYYNSTLVGNITHDTGSTSYGTSSDYRLKENEVAISDGITRLKQLKPYRFNFKTDANKTVDGFFAHEVSSVVPEAISGEKDAVDSEGNIQPQAIDQAKLVPLLTSALQEAITKIETLEARVQALESA